MAASRPVSLALAAGAALTLSLGSWLRFHVIAARSGRLDELREEVRSLGRSTAIGGGEGQSAIGAASGQDGLAELLHSLASDLDELRVGDRSLSTGSTSIHDGIERTSLNVAFKGAFSAAFELVKRVNDYKRVIRTSHLDITRDPHDQADALSVSMRFEVFAPSEKESR